MDDVELLELAIEKSGLSARRFAVEVMAGRDERTIRRWLAGDLPLTANVRAWLILYLRGDMPPERIPVAERVAV